MAIIVSGAASTCSKRVRACACYSLALWTTWTVRSSQAFPLSPNKKSTAPHPFISRQRRQVSQLTATTPIWQQWSPPPLSVSTSLSSSSSSSKLMMSTDETVTDVDIDSNLKAACSRISACCEENGRQVCDVRLVAVSKTKPLLLVQLAYKSGQRVFGENYVQELVEKAAEMEQHKDDIQWHFIGGLQSNKANMLVKGVVPFGKLVVETVGGVKVANKLDNAMSGLSENGGTKQLEVFVQINTSGEESKSGIAVEDMDAVIGTCKHIVNECDHLSLKGVMTIGAPGDESCLDKLVECRTAVATALDMDDPKQLELSMGMSGDFEAAIAKGSTNVRVGSTIFGARDYSNVK